jgi:hypothetical protein
MPKRPILIAYDGSEDAKSAITSAGELLTPGPALVVTIWPAAERVVSTSAGPATYAPIFGEIDELERANARASAEQGAALAREAGFDASPATLDGRAADRSPPGQHRGGLLLGHNHRRIFGWPSTAMSPRSIGVGTLAQKRAGTKVCDSSGGRM